MPAPRHLWSGDWRRESAAAADELAERRAPASEPSATTPEPAATRSTPSMVARARAWLRELRLHPRRGPVLMALAMLISAGLAYALVSALVEGDGHPASASRAALSTGAPAAAGAPGWLGVDTISFPLAAGALIVDVTPGSPAAAAGLQPGDVITQIGSRAVQSPADLESALAGMHAGQRVQIQSQEGPITNTAQVTLGARAGNGP